MRQTDKFYWAKYTERSKPETVYLHADGSVYRTLFLEKVKISSFFYFSEEPIEEPKIPLVLKDNRYYVIQPPGLCKVLGLHNQGRFDVIGGFWRESDVNVIAGPFTIEELVEFKPIT